MESPHHEAEVGQQEQELRQLLNKDKSKRSMNLCFHLCGCLSAVLWGPLALTPLPGEGVSMPGRGRAETPGRSPWWLSLALALGSSACGISGALEHLVPPQPCCLVTAGLGQAELGTCLQPQGCP